MPSLLRPFLRSLSAFALVLPVVSVSRISAQELAKEKQASLLLSAREQYYNLRAAGASGYTCQVNFNWDGFFTAVTGKALPADDPTMIYLNGLKVQLVNDLSGQSEVKFTPTSTVPEGKQQSLEKLQGSIKEMVNGFAQAWTPTLNGTIIPESPASLKKTSDGYLLHDATGDGSDETFDSKLRLTSLIVKSEAMASAMRTTFSPSAKGLLMTEMEGSYSQPASAPATDITMKTSFQTFDGFQLPATLAVTVPNVAAFDFTFTACTVQKAKP